MKKITLKKLSIKNFKGLKSLEIDPDGKNLEIFGANATGKSSIFDAFTWCLFGKDSKGSANFQVKPMDDSGNEIHHLETEVEIIFSIADIETSFSRLFKEKYTKTRGQAQGVFTGHTTDYFVDHVPVKASEFEKKIEAIIDKKSFRLLTDPAAFCAQHWSEQRNLLMEICGGEFSDEKIMLSDPRLEDLPKILGDLDVDKKKATIKSTQKKINDELKEIPVRISEIQESIKETVKPDKKARLRLESNLEKLEEELRKIRSTEDIQEKKLLLSEKKSELEAVKAELARKNNEAMKKAYSENEKIMAEVEKLNREFDEKKSQSRNFSSIIKDHDSDIYVAEKEMEFLKKKWHETKKEIEETKKEKFDGEDSCPVCGQDLPEDQIQAAIDKFEKRKLERLEKLVGKLSEINLKGKKEKKDCDEFGQKIEEFRKKLAVVDSELEKLKEKTNKKLAGIKEDIKPEKFPELEKKVAEFVQECENIQTELSEMSEGTTLKESAINEKISEVKQNIQEVMQSEAAYDISKSSRIRIKELEEREKALSRSYENLEKELFLIDQFIVRKVKMTEMLINQRFQITTFKLFKEQINGGIEECCEALHAGIPFDRGLNASMKINVGLDIIRTLCDYFKYSAPVFVDNAESVNRVEKIDSQLITLNVSTDKKLKIKEQ